MSYVAAEAVPALSAGVAIFVTNSDYLSEIKQMSNNAYHYVGVDHDLFRAKGHRPPFRKQL